MTTRKTEFKGQYVSMTASTEVTIHGTRAPDISSRKELHVFLLLVIFVFNIKISLKLEVISFRY